MSDSDDVLRRAEQPAQVEREAGQTVHQVSEGNVPVQQVRQLENALTQIPEVQPATQQVQRAEHALQQVTDVAERVLGAASGLEALSEVVQAVADGKPLDMVRFSFRSSSDPGGAWRVVELHAREGLSELYTCTVHLANEHLSADVDGLLGSSAELLISHEAGARRLCGIIHRVEHAGTQAGHLLARVHMAPALWALSQQKDHRIFQEKKVPEILKEVLTQGLQPFQRSFRIELNREYLPREYCVQYRETDLDFLLRLMEEEGIFFYFDHSGDKEELVLLEENEQGPTCEAVNGTPITVKGPEASTASDECLRHFDFSQQLHTTSVVVRDFNWTHPDYDLTRESRAKDALGRERESYEYPAPLLGPYDAGEKKYKYEPAQKQELVRRQAFQAEGKRGKGLGYVTGFTAGHMFELTGHGHAALDQWYLLTRVEHHGHAPEELTSDTHALSTDGDARERYHNTFECVPLDVPFRPERRRQRARMAGLQTATVVGPAGEEVHTDEHGRIKVQFHWDRKGQKDDRSSCFLRVAQAWAGPGWGFVFLPRVGMEVLVDFLEGDPDRPIVVGSVYNGMNPPPYSLPEHKTRSTIRTSSSKGGGGFNELRFEDASGAEEVFLHAQKDFNEVVLNNHSTSVKADQTNAVDGNQAETVVGNQTMSVTGTRTKTVDKDETTLVHGNRTETVDKNELISIQGNQTVGIQGNQSVAVELDQHVSVHGAQGVDVTKDRNLHVGMNLSESVEKNRKTTINLNDELAVLGEQNLRVAKTQRSTLEGDHLVTVGGKQTVAVKGDQGLHAAGSQTLSSDKEQSLSAPIQHLAATKTLDVQAAEKATIYSPDIQISGNTLTIKFNGDIKISGQTITLEASTLELNGTRKVTMGAGVEVDIQAALIKLN